MKIEINGKRRVEIRGVSLSEVTNTTLQYNSDYDRVFYKFFN